MPSKIFYSRNITKSITNEETTSVFILCQSYFITREYRVCITLEMCDTLGVLSEIFPKKYEKCKSKPDHELREFFLKLTAAVA